MFGILLALLAIAYPLLVWAALEYASARAVAVGMIALLVAIAVLLKIRSDELVSMLLKRFGVLAIFAAAAAATDDPFALKLVPVVTHVWLFVTFASTLVHGPPFAEQFARRAHHGDLPDFIRPYTRNVTLMWCAFFALNAVVFTALAFTASTDLWAAYTGFWCYVLSFVLIVGEYVFHKARFRYYEDVWTDRLIWRRLLPPERTKQGRETLAFQEMRRRERQAGAAGRASTSCVTQ